MSEQRPADPQMARNSILNNRGRPRWLSHTFNTVGLFASRLDHRKPYPLDEAVNDPENDSQSLLARMSRLVRRQEG